MQLRQSLDCCVFALILILVPIEHCLPIQLLLDFVRIFRGHRKGTVFSRIESLIFVVYSCWLWLECMHAFARSLVYLIMLLLMFLRKVKTTQDVTFVRQDAAEWCQRILDVIDRPKEASERALVLQGALKRDEYFRNTHDDFIAWCLGKSFEWVSPSDFIPYVV